jgi:hypothetical protein
MSKTSGQTPGPVPVTANYPGEIYGHFPYVEPQVWTARMLAALENGVKDAFFAEHGLFSLQAAHDRVCQSSLR